MQKDFKVTTELAEGGGGIFDVFVDGDLIFSKEKHDRFPEPSEITEILRSKV